MNAPARRGRKHSLSMTLGMISLGMISLGMT